MEAEPPPWMRPDLLPEKPDAESYGYIFQDNPVKCTREELMKRVRLQNAPQVALVWAPEVTRLVPAIELPFLLETVCEGIRKRITTNQTIAAFSAVVWGLPVLLSLGAGGGRNFQWQFMLMLSFGIIPMAEGWWELRRLRDRRPETISGRVASARYALWVRRQDRTVTWILVGVIVLVFFLELGRGLEFSINRAGLIKTGFHASDSYRFLTAALLHVNVMHVFMNAISLFILGMVMEGLVGGPAMALIFTFSALCGNACSFHFTSQTSAGASGGIMGLVGCLAVLGFHFRKILPPKFGWQMAYAVLITAFTGVIAHSVIDNAAHAGGAVGGAVLGWALFQGHQTLPLRPPPEAQWAGRASIALILLAALFIIGLMLRMV